MRTTYASKSQRRDGTTQTKRYWYYTSKQSSAEDKTRIERLPAIKIERLVLKYLNDRLIDETWLADQAGRALRGGGPIADIIQAARSWSENMSGLQGVTIAQDLQGVIDRIDEKKARLHIQVNLPALPGLDVSQGAKGVTIEVPFQKRQNGRAKPMIIAPADAPQPDAELIARVADARRWADELLAGKSATIQQIDEREGLRSGSVNRILPLAWACPGHLDGQS